MKTFRYETSELTATDLREELDGYAGRAEQYVITIFDETGTQPYAERAQALYLPDAGRLGIAWGAEATWADVRDVQSGIETWLNDADAWERAH